MDCSNLVKLCNNNSFVLFDLEKGGKIIKLVLFSRKSNQTITVIQGSSENILGDGSYLMFPWTNRLEKEFNIKDKTVDYPTRDGNGLPLHGLYTKIKRKVKTSTQTSIILIADTYNDSFPYFEEEFILNEDSLEINTRFFPRIDNLQIGFGYGYHPYISFNNSSINQLEIRTNMDSVLKVGNDMLPDGNKYSYQPINSVFPRFKTTETSYTMLLEDCFFDNCLRSSKELKEDYYVEIYDNESKNAIKVRTNNSVQKEGFLTIPLRYLQVYSPKERTSIAIEPQSITTNSFFIENDDLIKVFSNNYVGSLVIELVEYY